MCNCNKNKSGLTASPLKKAACSEMYDEIRLLEDKAYKLFRKFKYTTEHDNYLQIQVKTRKWKVDLIDRCPDEAEYLPIKEFIEEEYAKYF